MDTVSKKKRSEIMSKIKSKNTKPELLVRKYIFSRRYRYRIHDRKLPGCPDIVFKNRKLAIQVRGCFWHGHLCKLRSLPKSNRSFWNNKINNNKKRDIANDRKLKRLGWKVLVIRECHIKNKIYKQKIHSFLPIKFKLKRIN